MEKSFSGSNGNVHKEAKIYETSYPNMHIHLNQSMKINFSLSNHEIPY